MRPRRPNPFHPGDPISAAKLNETQEQAWIGSQAFGQGDAAVIRPAGSAPIIDVKPKSGIYARITGRGSGCANSGASGNPATPYLGTTGGNCYCGIQQLSRKDGSVADYEAGIHWDSFAYPLVEITGNTQVPVNAVVEATIAADRTHWEFLWAVEISASGSVGAGCGSGCTVGVDPQCFIQCVNNQLFVRPGCLYVVINGIRFYVQFEAL